MKRCHVTSFGPMRRDSPGLNTDFLTERHINSRPLPNLVGLNEAAGCLWLRVGVRCRRYQEHGGQGDAKSHQSTPFWVNMGALKWVIFVDNVAVRRRSENGAQRKVRG